MANPMIKAAPAVLTAAEIGLNYFTTRQQQAHELRMAQWQLGAEVATTAMQTVGQLVPRYWEYCERTEQQRLQVAYNVAQCHLQSQQLEADRQVQLATLASGDLRCNQVHEREMGLQQLLGAGHLTGEQFTATWLARK